MKTTLIASVILYFCFINMLDSKILPVENQKRSYPENSFTLVSLNTWGLPIWFPNSDQNNRFTKIVNELESDKFEVVCLQETFNHSLRDMIYQNLDNDFYMTGDRHCNRKVYGTLDLDCNGGLMILSKYPIIDEVFLPFAKNKRSSVIENIGNKGVLIATINLYSDTITILNTHLYANHGKIESEIRLEQIQFIQNLFQDHPLI